MIKHTATESCQCLSCSPHLYHEAQGVGITKGARVAYLTVLGNIDFGTVMGMVLTPDTSDHGTYWEWCAQVNFDTGNEERAAFDLMYRQDLYLV